MKKFLFAIVILGLFGAGVFGFLAYNDYKNSKKEVQKMQEQLEQNQANNLVLQEQISQKTNEVKLLTHIYSDKVKISGLTISNKQNELYSKVFTKNEYWGFLTKSQTTVYSKYTADFWIKKDDLSVTFDDKGRCCVNVISSKMEITVTPYDFFAEEENGILFLTKVDAQELTALINVMRQDIYDSVNTDQNINRALKNIKDYLMEIANTFNIKDFVMYVDNKEFKGDMENDTGMSASVPVTT